MQSLNFCNSSHFLCIVSLKALNEVAGKKIESQLFMSFHYSSQIFFVAFRLIYPPNTFYVLIQMGLNVVEENTFIFKCYSHIILTIRHVIRTNHHEWNGIRCNMFETQMVKTLLLTEQFIYWNSIIWKKRFMCVIKNVY